VFLVRVSRQRLRQGPLVQAVEAPGNLSGVV